MLFTIAIPTYNNAKTLEETIESCINQDIETNYEVLVVDNNSTDDTKTILKSYENKVKIVTNDITVSMWENHNVCLQHAEGDYTIFCHSDDRLLPDALTKLFIELNKKEFPKSIVIWGRSFFRDFYGNWNNAGFHLNEIATGITCLDVFFMGGLTPSGTCYSTKSFIELSGFLKVEHKLGPSDMVTMWKLVMNCFEFLMIDRVLFIRKEASTASGSAFNKNNIQESIKVAILTLKAHISEEDFNMIIDRFRSSNVFNIFVAKALFDNDMIVKKALKRKAIKYFLKNPFLFRKKETWLTIFE
jgi:glycosyltransferase involved in cell wall biosynthesis